MKKILGLDLGTNSIGWALIQQDFDNKQGNIIDMGVRIIPMGQDILGKFDSGVSISQTAERTGYRGVRRLYQRDNLRRERLHRVLNILGFLPEHYSKSIDFENRKGQFKDGQELKLNFRPVDKKEDGKITYDFLFKESFDQMVLDFASAGHGSKIPYDWTLYYLRKKALTKKITREELAWVILNFNQKRGYYQLRGEEEETDTSKKEQYYCLKVKEVQKTDEKNAKGDWYNIVLENDWVYKRQSKDSLKNWLGMEKEFIITTQLEKDGTPKKDKEGEIRRSFRAVDSEKDWIAIKTKTEQDIEKSDKTVGEFIYETLLKNPAQKIRGKLVRTIERKYYKAELEKILNTQCSLHPELKSEELYNACIKELYAHNEAHKANIKDKGFKHLFLNDIIFYQRPLKSKKSSISACTYEKRKFKKNVTVQENGQVVKKEITVEEGVKVIPKSHPLFQEFRLWQFIGNLKIYKLELTGEEDVTFRLLSKDDDWVKLFDFLNGRKDVTQNHILNYLQKEKLIPKNENENYRWNYVEDKTYPCNETHSQFLSRLEKVNNIDANTFLTPETETYLWHIIYSVKDKTEYEQALKTFSQKHNIDQGSFIENFKKFPPFSADYGAYSYKAIKKLLPLMRMGKYWNEKEIPKEIKERIDKLLSGEVDEKISNRTREKAINLQNINDFKGLPVWLACYVVYGRHSESGDSVQWKSPEDINTYLNEFRQHSLRNPIVEQVITETLRTVRDIWVHYGKGQKDFFNEIHVELGREMKNPAGKRKAIANRNLENEKTNYRIRELLTELMNDSNTSGDIRPYSPSHQEILKIYEEGIYQNPNADYDRLSSDDVNKIRGNNSPTNSDIKRYKLWLEQGYRSPYTGKTISLTHLFTEDYQIEHIIPQSRYFDDSLSNKVICESAINPNPYKDNQTGYEFIKNQGGRIVPELSTESETIKLFTLDEYEAHCNRYFKNNKEKLKKLLSEDIPEGFIERQLNDSRYISKFVKSLLSNIVREDNEQEATSKKIVPVTGTITTKLKQDWGLNDKWNEIVAPRFKRLNELTGSNNFGSWDNNINAFRVDVPPELKRGFNKKRIDHRHHALDALVIACTTRKHIQYLNALNNEKENYTLKDALLTKNQQNHYTKNFLLPWPEFPTEAHNSLQKTIISFKQNLRVINKTNNKTWQWTQNNGQLKKVLVKQTKGDNWSIRKPLHKETVYGKVSVKTKKEVSFANGIKEWEYLVDKALKQRIIDLIKEGKNEKSILKLFKDTPYTVDGKEIKRLQIYTYTKDATASRVALSESFSRKQLESVTDSGIKKILKNHLKSYTDENGKERFDLAFSPEGIKALNKNIKELNNGKGHQPIYKVRVYEEGSRFNVGFKGNKKAKMVEAAKGTNLFFAIYKNEEKQKREYETIPLNVVTEHQKIVAKAPKKERSPVPVNKNKGELLFVLSPNDLVYVPTEEEIETPSLVDFTNLSKEQTGRIYKMVSSSGNQVFFLKAEVANSIWNKNEFSSLNKMEKDIEGRMIKEYCWKLKVDRLGNITGIVK